MKIVREYIEFKNLDFERDLDPRKSIGIGKVFQIEAWLDSVGIDPDDYRINKDLSIDVFDDVNLVGQEMEELPDFIKFNKIYGGFYAGGNNWISLNGFPEEIEGDLQLRSPAAYPFFADMKRITEEEIKKLIKVHGKIYK